MDLVRRSINITERQNQKLEAWKWKYRKSCSEIVRKLVDYYIKNPNKLKEILKKGGNKI